MELPLLGGRVKKQVHFGKTVHFQSWWGKNEFSVRQTTTCGKGDLLREILPQSAPEEQNNLEEGWIYGNLGLREGS